MSDSQIPVPESTWKDNVYAALQVGAEAAGTSLGVPLVGGALFGAVFTPPFQKRVTRSIELIIEAIDELRIRGVDVEALSRNEQFIDSMLKIYQVANFNSAQEKREALRNAVLNCGLPDAPDATRQHLFVSLIDNLSPAHLRLLAKLGSLPSFYKESGKQMPTRDFQSVWEVLLLMDSSLKSEEWLYDQVCRDLNRHGLLILQSVNDRRNDYHFNPERPSHEQRGYLNPSEVGPHKDINVGSPRVIRQWTSRLGDEFLAFIRSPLQAAPVASSDAKQ